MERLLNKLVRFRLAVVLVLGVVLFLPSMGNGFMADDWFQIAMIEDVEFLPDREPLDLFTFVADRDASFTTTQGKFLPWWASDDFTASFFRPLTALTHHLDHRVFGRLPSGHHATSLALWALLLFVVVRFFETAASDSGRGPTVVFLAGLLYALDDAHVWNIGWLANRNALLCVGFGTLALWLHHLHRRDGSYLALLGSLAAYVFALLSGEAGISVVMWVVAYELCLGVGGRWARLRSLAPVALCTGLYLVAWSYLGHGASGSTLYVSPFERPQLFISEALLERIPLLITGALWPIPAETGFMLSGSQAPVRVMAWLCSALAVVVFWPLMRRDAMCRFFGLGALLCMVPLAGTFAHNRLLLFPTVGTSWLLACWLSDWSRAAPVRGEGVTALWKRKGSLVAVFIVIVHLLGVVPGALFGQHMLRAIGQSGVDYALNADIPVSAEGEPLRVFSLNSVDPISPTYLPLIRWAAGASLAEAYWSLSIIPGDQVMVRTGENTFRLEAGKPGFLSTGWESLFRALSPVREGDEFRRGALTVRADRVEEEKLLAIEVELERSLDDPRTVLLAWDGERMGRLRPPALGECRLLPLEGYGLGLPIPAHPALSHLCADHATFMGDSDPGESPGASGVEATAPSTERPVTSGVPVEPSPGHSCSLEVWTGGEWVHSRTLSCPDDGTLRLLSVGDVGRAGGILDASVAEMQRHCAGDTCQLMLIAGDLIYGPGAQASETWRAVWDQSLAQVGLPGLAVLGNHEYRHEPGPELKREVLFSAHGRAGLVLPGAHYAARIRAGDEVLLSVAALDTDSLSLPGPDKPGLGLHVLAEACAQGAPVIALGHHPPSSQGRHHTHEAWLEAQLREVLATTSAGGCNLIAYAAGHDHDLQAYGPGCEAPGVPAVVVSGVVARGYRGPGSEHLRTCRREGAQSSYHAGPRKAGGFAILELDLRTGGAAARLIDVPSPGESRELGRVEWQFPASKGE